MAIIPTHWRDLPADSSMQVGLDVYARTVGALADASNHLAGARFRRVVTSHEMMSFIGSLPENPLATQNVGVRWITNPLTTYVWVGFDYLAPDRFGTYQPSIALSTHTAPAGVVVDTGYTVSIANGLLSSSWPWAMWSQLHVPNSPPRQGFWHSGFERRPIATTAPRLMQVTPGADMELRAVCTDARIYSISVAETVEATI